MSKEAYKTEFKRWCVENRFSAPEIAKTIGCSKKSIYAYMQGTRFPSRKTMKIMEESLGIDARKVFKF